MRLIDSVLRDGLTDTFSNEHMGVTVERERSARLSVEPDTQPLPPEAEELLPASEPHAASARAPAIARAANRTLREVFTLVLQVV